MVCFVVFCLVGVFFIITEIIDYSINSYFKRNEWALSLYKFCKIEDNLYLTTGLTFLHSNLPDNGKKKSKGETSSTFVFSVNTVCKISLLGLSDLFAE